MTRKISVMFGTCDQNVVVGFSKHGGAKDTEDL